jgi:hypothetical protein
MPGATMCKAASLEWMGQAIHDIRHLLDLANTLRRDAGQTDQTPYSEKLIEAAAQLEYRADLLTKRDGYFFV